jgi:hypothetical protein
MGDGNHRNTWFDPPETARPSPPRSHIAPARPVTRETIALALCCPDPDGCREEYRDQVKAIADLFGIPE